MQHESGHHHYTQSCLQCPRSQGANTVTYLHLTGDNSQEILALTGGGQTREYTETRPDGTTVTYTIDVEEEIVEVGDGRQ